MKYVKVNKGNYLPVDYNGFTNIKDYIIIHDTDRIPKRDKKNYLIFYRWRNDIYLVHVIDTKEKTYVNSNIIEKKEEIYEALNHLNDLVKIFWIPFDIYGNDFEEKVKFYMSKHQDYQDTCYNISFAISIINSTFKEFEISESEFESYCKENKK